MRQFDIKIETSLQMHLQKHFVVSMGIFSL